MMSRFRLFAATFLATAAGALSAPEYPAPTESDYTIHDFKFRSGESLPELRIHYRTIGKLEKDAQGTSLNAILIMHGTTGSGAQFIRPEFAGELFGGLFTLLGLVLREPTGELQHLAARAQHQRLVRRALRTRRTPQVP